MAFIQIIRNPSRLPSFRCYGCQNSQNKGTEIVSKRICEQSQSTAQTSHGIRRLIIEELILPNESENLCCSYQEIMCSSQAWISEEGLHQLIAKLPGSIKEMGSEAVQAGKVYRQLLKAVTEHIGKDGNPRHFQDFIAQEFRKNAGLSDQAVVQRKMKLARDYTFLLNSVHHHKELLFSYNIAVDRSDEMKKILNKSAASVGLRLPGGYQP